MKEKWAENLSSRMQGYTEPVSGKVWEGISGTRRRAFIFPWWLLATAAAGAVAAVLLLRSSAEGALPSDAPASISELVSEASPSNAPRLISEVPAAPASGPSRSAAPVSRKASTAAEPAGPSEPVAQAAEPAGPSEPAVQAPEPPEPGPQAKPRTTGAEDNAVIPEPDSSADFWADIPEKPGRRTRISASLLAQVSPGNALTGFNASYMYGSNLGRTATTPGSSVSDPDMTSDKDGKPEEDPSSGDSENTPPTKSKPGQAPVQEDQAGYSPVMQHLFPVKFGAALSFSISERFSVDTGLDYLWLRSTGAREQQLHFVGIPVKVDYNILNYRPLSLYVAAGVEAFKCIAGNGPDKPWLFSAGIGAGIGVALSPSVSLYAEPGFAAYFHTGLCEHYYTQNPYAASLSVGIKLNL